MAALFPAVRRGFTCRWRAQVLLSHEGFLGRELNVELKGFGNWPVAKLGLRVTGQLAQGRTELFLQKIGGSWDGWDEQWGRCAGASREDPKAHRLVT